MKNESSPKPACWWQCERERESQARPVADAYAARGDARDLREARFVVDARAARGRKGRGWNATVAKNTSFAENILLLATQAIV